MRGNAFPWSVRGVTDLPLNTKLYTLQQKTGNATHLGCCDVPTKPQCHKSAKKNSSTCMRKKMPSVRQAHAQRTKIPSMFHYTLP